MFVTDVDPDTGKDIRMSVYGKTQRETCEKMLAVLSGKPYAEDAKDNPNRRLSYSVQEAAKMIGVGTRTIYRLAKAKGYLPFRLTIGMSSTQSYSTPGSESIARTVP